MIFKQSSFHGASRARNFTVSLKPSLRQHSLRWAFLLGALLQLSFSKGSCAAVSPPSPVALSGTAAPAGGNYGSFSLPPIINAAGQVAFVANLSGGSSASGLFSGASGAIQPVALQGIAAPAGGNFSSFLSPVINSAGQIAFYAQLTGGTATSGIYFGTPGSLQTVAVRGMTVPAVGNISSLSGIGLSSSGQVGFIADLSGGTSTQGLFLGTPSSLQVLGLQGPAPGGTTHATFSNVFQINTAGTTVFSSTPTVSSLNRSLFAGAPGGVQPVALYGEVTPLGGNYDSFLNPMINNSNQVSFVGLIANSSAPSAIFTNVSGSLQAIAVQGMPSALGDAYLAFQNPVLNNSGQIVFGAVFQSGSLGSGIFLYSPSGTTQTVALLNDTSPDGIGRYSNFLTRTTLNDLGQVAFTVNLLGTGVTSANDRGIFAGTPGNISKIVRKGDVIDVDPGP